MGCLFALLTGLFPRVGLVLVWIFTSEIDRAYDSVILPLLGLIFLPLTTLVYALLWNPAGGVEGIEWFWVALAFLLDVGAVGGAALAQRRLAPGARPQVAAPQHHDVGRHAPEVAGVRSRSRPPIAPAFTQAQGTVSRRMAAAVTTKTTELGDSRVRLEVEVPSEALELGCATPPPSWAVRCACPASAPARCRATWCCARSAARP